MGNTAALIIDQQGSMKNHGTRVVSLNLFFNEVISLLMAVEVLV
jgi:hypothetical protein